MVTSAWLPRISVPRPRRAEHARRARGEEFDNPAERNLVSAMQMRDCQAQRSFQAGDPEGGAFELDDLFVRRVGRVVGGDRINGAVGQRHQDGLAIGSPSAAADSS